MWTGADGNTTLHEWTLRPFQGAESSGKDKTVEELSKNKDSAY